MAEMTLLEFCERHNESTRGGWFGLSSWHKPELTEEQGNETAEWYTIGIIGANLVLRADDVPAGDYEYRDIRDKVKVIIKRKTSKELWDEEEEARAERYQQA
ncbi:hypothetical protein HGI30_15335 [Paenibacillus albicereus]|uniref:Uncharacterized protein n=1 Tax=Paenibacillus albicereus TaxID=2726185 RepID=A0A6H2GZH3_9BACL|nr:hypothetical protein [Paenibacillus albicereus]QJC52805.1 hypothetical protein HGI30_15335 [Paenibacillus albicereus]